MKNPIPLLRNVALIEAVSYLLLLGIAMPLKYIWHQPLAVRVFGSVHGLFFILYCFALWQVLIKANWPFRRIVLVFVASLLPFVPFILDGRLKLWASEFDEKHQWNQISP